MSLNQLRNQMDSGHLNLETLVENDRKAGCDVQQHLKGDFRKPLEVGAFTRLWLASTTVNLETRLGAGCPESAATCSAQSKPISLAISVHSLMKQ